MKTKQQQSVTCRSVTGSTFTCYLKSDVKQWLMFALINVFVYESTLS